jgi:hypothetical protein
MAVGSIYEVKVRSLAAEGQLFNLLHYTQTAGPAEAEVQTQTALALAWDAACSQEWVDVYPTVWTLADVAVSRIVPLPRQAETLRALNVPGNRAVTPLPAEVAVVLTKRSPIAGKANRGRVYLSGAAQADTSGGKVIAGAYATAAQLLADKLATVLTTVGPPRTFAPCIYHRLTFDYTIITSCLVRPVLRAQRRRQAGVGI